MSGLFGKLGGIRNAVSEGISEFSRDALKEGGGIINDTASNAVKQTAAVATNAARAGKAAGAAAKSVRTKVVDAGRKRGLQASSSSSQLELEDNGAQGSDDHADTAASHSSPDLVLPRASSTSDVASQDKDSLTASAEDKRGAGRGEVTARRATDDWDFEDFGDSNFDNLQTPKTKTVEDAATKSNTGDTPKSGRKNTTPAKEETETKSATTKATPSKSPATKPTTTKPATTKSPAVKSPAVTKSPPAPKSTEATSDPATPEVPKATKPATSKTSTPDVPAVSKAAGVKTKTPEVAKAGKPASKTTTPEAVRVTKPVVSKATTSKPASTKPIASAGELEALEDGSDTRGATEESTQGWAEEKAQLEKLCESLRASLDEGEQQAEKMALELDLEKETNKALQEETRKLKELLSAEVAEKEEKVKEREDIESRVEELASSLESRMEDLTVELEGKDKEIVKLKQDNETQHEAFEELKTLLNQSVEERDRLSDELKDTERVLVDVRRDLQESEERLDSQRRKLAEESATFAQERARFETLETTSLGAEERLALEDKLAQATTRIADTMAEVRSMQEKLAEAEKRAADNESAYLKANREAEATKASLAAAEAHAEAEKVERMEVEGETARMKEDSERRAKTFNNAVAAAVNKIKTTLENERDTLAENVTSLQASEQKLKDRIGELEEMLEASESKAGESLAQAEHALSEAASAQDEATRCSQLAEARSRRLAEMETLREEAVGNAAKASKEAVDASERAAALEERCGELEAKCSSLEETLNDEQSQQASETERLNSSMETLQSALSLAEAARDASDASQREASAASSARESVQAAKIEELEADNTKRGVKIQELEASLQKLRTRKTEMEAGLTGLGLEAANTLKAFKDNILGGDVEMGDDLERSNSGTKGGAIGGGRPRQLPRRKALDSKVQQGAISRRSAMMLLYFIALHVLVMASFTRRPPALNIDCPDIDGHDSRLP